MILEKYKGARSCWVQNKIISYFQDDYRVQAPKLTNGPSQSIIKPNVTSKIWPRAKVLFRSVAVKQSVETFSLTDTQKATEHIFRMLKKKRDNAKMESLVQTKT